MKKKSPLNVNIQQNWEQMRIRCIKYKDLMSFPPPHSPPPPPPLLNCYSTINNNYMYIDKTSYFSKIPTTQICLRICDIFLSFTFVKAGFSYLSECIYLHLLHLIIYDLAEIFSQLWLVFTFVTVFTFKVRTHERSVMYMINLQKFTRSW